jgi:predicted SprT family Zn-dependent metalloprotease
MYVSKKNHIIRRVRENVAINGYETNNADINVWFKILNKDVFKSKLKRFHLIYIEKTRGTSGGCIYEFEEDTDRYLASLQMNPTYVNFNDFLFTLAHEMVHSYEWTVQNVVPCHGKNFWKWKSRLAKFEIILTKEF